MRKNWFIGGPFDSSLWGDAYRCDYICRKEQYCEIVYSMHFDVQKCKTGK
jgi:hypothetical protein